MKSTKCPYFPSCSQYGLEAVARYGAWKGGLLCVWRILRCNPFSKGGYDPVPSMAYVTHVDKDAKRVNEDCNTNAHRKEKNWKTFYKL